jgi:hypothetical protein
MPVGGPVTDPLTYDVLAVPLYDLTFWALLSRLHAALAVAGTPSTHAAAASATTTDLRPPTPSPTSSLTYALHLAAAGTYCVDAMAPSTN